MPDVNLNPAADDTAASTTPATLDPVTLVAAKKLRYQWDDTSLISIPALPHPTTWRRPKRKSENPLLTFAAAGVVTTFTSIQLDSTAAAFVGLVVASFAMLGLYVGDARSAEPAYRVPANVSAAWNRVRSVTAAYAHALDAAAPRSLLELEAGSWMAVEEIAAHVKDGTLGHAECVAALDALFTAAAQADTYDLLRKHATQLEPAHSPAAALLATSDIDGALALLAPAPVEPQAISAGY